VEVLVVVIVVVGVVVVGVVVMMVGRVSVATLAVVLVVVPVVTIKLRSSVLVFAIDRSLGHRRGPSPAAGSTTGPGPIDTDRIHLALKVGDLVLEVRGRKRLCERCLLGGLRCQRALRKAWDRGRDPGTKVSTSTYDIFAVAHSS
jgi:hypothetical protein